MRFNDLEAGFEKHLALAYGRHIITGHPVEHSIGLEGGAGTNITNPDKRVVLKVALGDGAPDVDGEGSWAGGAIATTAQRLYLPSGQAAPVSPAYSDGWDQVGTGAARLKCVTTKTTADAPYERAEAEKLANDPGTRTVLMRQFVSNPLAAQIISGTVKGQAQWASEAGDGNNPPPNMTAALRVFVVSNDGSVVRGVLLNTAATDNAAYYLPEFNGNPLLNRRFRDALDRVDIPLNDLAVLSGDRLVIEVGMKNRDGSTHARTGYVMVGNVHNGFPGTISVDLPEQDGESFTHIPGFPAPKNPWVEFSSPLQFLSEESTGTPDIEVIYAGETIPAQNWGFHPGTLSRGKSDPIQGIDAFFPNGLTYSATAYICVVLPDGIDDDGDPSKLAVLIYTSQIGDYDEDGNRTAIAYSPNPARVKANMLRRIGQHSRIYGPKFVAARDYYDGEISAPVSNENSYAAFDGVPEYEAFGPVSANAMTGAITPTAGKIDGYDNRAVTKQRIVGGDDGAFAFTIGAAFPTGTAGGEAYLVDKNGLHWFGIAWGNGHFGILANEVPIDDPTIPYDYPAANGDNIELIVDSGFFVLKQNGNTLSIPQGAAPAPDDVDLFGKIILWENTAQVSASNLTGSETTDTTVANEMVPRFEAHPAFTGPVDIATALDFVDSLCCSDTQDAGRHIVFLTPEARASVHTFDEDTNVVGRTIKFYTTDIRERPNRLWAKFRNLDLRYLEQDSVFDLRDELFDKVGRPIDPGALNFGSMRSSQAQRGIHFEMRRRSDNKLWTQLTGMDDSFAVLPADVVKLITRKIRVKVDGGYDAAAVSIDLEPGEGAKLPATPFFATWWNVTDYPIPFKDPNREIVQVTAIVDDTLTIMRGSEGTVASTKNAAGKSYALGRYPKEFLVIAATRESPEALPSGLQREFTLQEYFPDDYRDTDHDVPQVPLSTQPPSSFSGPAAPVLMLSQDTVEGVGGALVTRIMGTVYFANFNGSQTAKIYVTRPGGSEQDTGIVVSPASGTNLGAFEYFPDVLGEYQFRAEAISATGVVGGSGSASITIGDIVLEDDTLDHITEDGTGQLLTEG